MTGNFVNVLKVVLFAIIGVTCSQANEDAVTSKVMCETSKGEFVIDVYRAWAPIGADHFIDLVKNSFYTDVAFFRCVEGFLTQFGISDKEDMQHWHNENILDDVNQEKGIEKNYISFAGGGENTRSTQLFIAFEYLDFLGKEPWETPFGKVVEGQSTLDSLYKGYGEMHPFGQGPDQQEIFNQGNSYIDENFPDIDFIYNCRVIAEYDDDERLIEEYDIEKSLLEDYVDEERLIEEYDDEERLIEEYDDEERLIEEYDDEERLIEEYDIELPLTEDDDIEFPHIEEDDDEDSADDLGINDEL